MSSQVYHSFFWPLEWTVPSRDNNKCYAKIICNLKDNVSAVVTYDLRDGVSAVMTYDLRDGVSVVMIFLQMMFTF